jgi:BirA family biotin operon repressor/biotin-[acetyl-CoA-carboxylase] ligase
VRAPDGPWLELSEVATTQAIAHQQIDLGEATGVVFARHQTAGKGRLGRTWHSTEGDSLTASLIFHHYAGHPKPYLIGMACAMAVAGTIHSQLRWPNDLVIGTKKVGGILTELFPRSDGQLLPVVGIGINLNQRDFPEDLDRIATSLAIEHGGHYSEMDVARQIVARLALMPEPNEWSALAPVWDVFDRTPGKLYKLPSGELAEALGIGSDGQLLCSVQGESQTVMAAEAIFGHAR